MEKELNVIEKEFNLDLTIDATANADRELGIVENLLQGTEIDSSNSRENLLQEAKIMNSDGRENLLQDAEINNFNGNVNMLQDTEEVDNSSGEELPTFITTRSRPVHRALSDCKTFTVRKSASPLVAYRQRLAVKQPKCS